MSIEVEIEFDISLQGGFPEQRVERTILEIAPDIGNLLRESEKKSSFELKKMQETIKNL